MLATKCDSFQWPIRDGCERELFTDVLRSKRNCMQCDGTIKRVDYLACFSRENNNKYNESC